MKLLSYRHHDREGVGVLTDVGVVDVRDLDPTAPSGMRAVLEWLPGRSLDRASGTASALDPADVTFLPVVSDPHAIWCAALTYLSHVREGEDRPVPDYPLFFLRVAASQTAHLQPMVLPSVSDQLDYEGELAVVIGRRAHHISEQDALAYVAGYTCYNDGSVRDWQRHTSQITVGKNFAHTGGFGPWLVTPDEFGDARDHTLQTRVNGEVRQSAAISELLFGIEYQIHYLSTVCPLEVGDVIVTGTCGGVGLRRDPPSFLAAGDVVEVEISGIGTLRNVVVAEEDL